MPLLFSQGVRKGRITLNQFVALTSTNAARMYGIHPKKGTIAIGSDADIAIWDPELERRVSVDMLHDNMDYTPYDGWDVTGWPITVVSRGRVVVEDEELRVEGGSGRFLKRDPVDCTGMPGHTPPELDAAENFDANLI
jgi:dihydropyrimidinase